MCHQHKLLQPPPQLFHHPYDKFSPSKIIPTNHSPTTNKGKKETTELGIKATTNHKEVANNQILPTMSRKTDQLKNPRNQIHLDTTVCYTHINHENYVTSTRTIHMNSP